MPSLSARLVGFALRTTGYYRRMYSGGELFRKNLAKNRAARLAEPDARMKAKLDVASTEFQGRPVWTLSAKDRAPTEHVLYWHGGGYVYPATPAHWGFLATMAEKYGWSITAPLYPLAPEANAEQATAFALDFYRDYSAKRGGAPFAMGGDSAGGGLTVATAQLALGAGLPMPTALLLICPWLDANPANPEQRHIEPRDAILTLAGIAEAGQLYAANLPLNDPRVSPIHGNLNGLPPILAFGGSDDVLVTDARALKVKVPLVEYHEGAGLIHDWPIFTFPESRTAQARMAMFLGGRSAH